MLIFIELYYMLEKYEILYEFSFQIGSIDVINSILGKYIGEEDYCKL